MAAAKVFDTVELLEAILLELPIRDVLLAQRIAQTWQQTINGSIKLQRSLFLKPASYSISKSSSMQFVDLNTPCSTILQYPGPQTLLTSILPIIKSSTKTPTVLNFDHKPRKSNPNPNNENSAWKNMLLTQPPRTTAHFFKNTTNGPCIPTEESMNFHPRDDGQRTHVGAAAVITQGNIFDLNAVSIEKDKGFLTLGETERGLRELHRCWGVEKCRGRKEGDFGWVGFRELEAVVEFWEDITSVVVREMV